MGDEEVCQTVSLLEFLEQVHHLSLDTDIERGDGLITHDERRVQRQRPRDPDPLALAPTELVRKPVGHPGVEPDNLEQFAHPALPLPAVADVVDFQRLRDDRPDRQPGVQAGVRILEDNLHVPPTASQLRGGRLRQVLAFEIDGALGWLVELEDGPTGGALAATRLAHEAQRLASLDREADVVHRPNPADASLHDAMRHRKVHLEVLHPHEVFPSRFGLGGPGRGIVRRGRRNARRWRRNARRGRRHRTDPATNVPAVLDGPSVGWPVGISPGSWRGAVCTSTQHAARC